LAENELFARRRPPCAEAAGALERLRPGVHERMVVREYRHSGQAKAYEAVCARLQLQPKTDKSLTHQRRKRLRPALSGQGPALANALSDAFRAPSPRSNRPNPRCSHKLEPLGKDCILKNHLAPLQRGFFCAAAVT
jgi:hypothetical protein